MNKNEHLVILVMSVMLLIDEPLWHRSCLIEADHVLSTWQNKDATNIMKGNDDGCLNCRRRANVEEPQGTEYEKQHHQSPVLVI
jgi:hypothetical protein